MTARRTAPCRRRPTCTPTRWRCRRVSPRREPLTTVAMTAARRWWLAFEPVHAVVYFDPECLAAVDGLGFRGFWMGYFAGRAAPFGAVGPELGHGRILQLPPGPGRPGAARGLVGGLAGRRLGHPDACGGGDPAPVGPDGGGGGTGAWCRACGPSSRACPTPAGRCSPPPGPRASPTTRSRPCGTGARACASTGGTVTWPPSPPPASTGARRWSSSPPTEGPPAELLQRSRGWSAEQWAYAARPTGPPRPGRRRRHDGGRSPAAPVGRGDDRRPGRHGDRSCRRARGRRPARPAPGGGGVGARRPGSSTIPNPMGLPAPADV